MPRNLAVAVAVESSMAFLDLRPGASAAAIWYVRTESGITRCAIAVDVAWP